MDLEAFNTYQTLNEGVLMLIRDLYEQFGEDPKLPEIKEHLKRVSKYLHLKSLKLFDDENKK